MYIYIHAYSQTYMHIYIYIHTYIHTHTHTHTSQSQRVKGTIADPRGFAKSFDFNPEKQTPFEIANEIWGIMDGEE